jgi:hypothetical protein
MSNVLMDGPAGPGLLGGPGPPALGQGIDVEGRWTADVPERQRSWDVGGRFGLGRHGVLVPF